MFKKPFQTVYLKDRAYPSLLKEIHNPPKEITLKGPLPDQNRPHLAVVGSRQASPYGQQVAQMLVRELTQAGVVIVSGLAYGIDHIAHKTTIDNDGTTIAVLGFGINYRCAGRERRLQEEILASGGAIISEFAEKMPAQKHHFPKRNRIISGLCHGTLIIEAAERSGSLITARLAMEQNRNVFVVPGPITSPTSAGTNRFLKDGAIPVTGTQDILDVLGCKQQPITPREALSDNERALLDLLSQQPKHIDELIRAHGGQSNVVNVLVTSLEISGHIRDVGGRHFVIN